MNPDAEATRKVLSYLNTCGCDVDVNGEAQGVEGAYIGWSPFPVSLVRFVLSFFSSLLYLFYLFYLLYFIIYLFIYLFIYSFYYLNLIINLNE